jgi:hypothetical protein
VAKEPLTITVDPASELARALADADAAVVLDSGGVLYTVSRKDIFAGYDVQAVLSGLRRSRGALKGVDTAALLEDLAEQRSQDPRRRPT